MRLALYLFYHKKAYENIGMTFTIQSVNAYMIEYFDYIVKKEWYVADVLNSARGYLNESI